jgi:hypothetical protein
LRTNHLSLHAPIEEDCLDSHPARRQPPNFWLCAVCLAVLSLSFAASRSEEPCCFSRDRRLGPGDTGVGGACDETGAGAGGGAWAELLGAGTATSGVDVLSEPQNTERPKPKDEAWVPRASGAGAGVGGGLERPNREKEEKEEEGDRGVSRGGA